MRNRPIPVALSTGDWHLWHKPPVARTAEPDWWVAMSRPIHQIRELADKYKVPILFTGDLTDRYNPPPELLNWMLVELPTNMYGVPGQHDMPYHSAADLNKSAFWTMVLAGRITHLAGGEPLGLMDVVLSGFPWGSQLLPSPKRHSLEGRKHIAIVHAYCSAKGHSYPGAPETSRWTNLSKQLRGYDAVVVGDNHDGFLARTKAGMWVLNGGTMLRRKVDEIPYKPCVGIIYSDGTVKRHFLDCSADQFVDSAISDDAKKVGIMDLDEFLGGLRGLGDKALDFREAVTHLLSNINASKRLRKFVMEVVEGE